MIKNMLMKLFLSLSNFYVLATVSTTFESEVRKANIGNATTFNAGNNGTSGATEVIPSTFISFY